MTSIILLIGLAFTVASCGGPAPATGKAVFYISDAAAEMGAVSSVQITVDSLRIHSQGGAWTTVSTNAQSYDLLELKAVGIGKLLVQTNLNAGTYDQVELNISKVIVVDAQGSHEAKLPSSELRVKAAIEVNEGTTATVNFDFAADQSLHLTGEGKYILAPVIQVESRNNAQVQVTANNEVRVNGGNVAAQAQVGMDIEGNLGVGPQISQNTVLSIEASGKIVQVKGQSFATGTIKAIDTITETVTITTKDEGDLVLYLSPDSKLVIDGSISTLDGLKAKTGGQIRIQYDVTTKAIATAEVSAKTEGNIFLTLSGVLKAVNIPAQTVTIATETQGDVTLNIASNTNIMIGGTIFTLGALATKIGSRATVEYNAQTKAVTNINVQVSATVSGTLKAVSPLTQTITITTEAGTDIVLNVTPNTRLQVRGVVSTLLSLVADVGSKVNVEYDAMTNTAISVNVQG